MRERRSELVEVELPDGQVVLAEVDAFDGDVAFADRFKLDQLGATAAKIGAWARDNAMSAMPRPPDRLGIQIGMKLAMKNGILTSVLASVSGEGSVVVTMEWDVNGTS